MSNNTTPNPNCVAGRKFTHKNGKQYIVHSKDGCFHSSSGPIFGRFGAQSLKDGQPFGPMREMVIANVKSWD